MMDIRWFAGRRPLFLPLGLVLCLICFGVPASAQKVMSGSARRSVVQGVGVIPSGTLINVRTDTAINTNSSNGRVFHGVVDHDVYGRDGNLVIPRGADAELIVRRVSNDELALDLESVVVNGERYGVEASGGAVSSSRDEGIGANDRTGKFVGGGAILGAIVGAIAGGGKGAAIGAGAGAAAGAGAQVLTRGGRIDVPAESLLSFQLAEPLRAGIADGGYSQRGDHYHRGYGNNAYERGVEDGRADAERNLPENMDPRQFRDWQDRRDYEAGYNQGYQNGRENDYGREKPGSPSYAGSPWRISIGAHQNISWQAPEAARIYVQVDNEAPKLFASGQSGTQAAPWMTPGHIYVFILQDQNGREVARTQQDLR